jgi:preprotein translocase subunit SecY
MVEKLLNIFRIPDLRRRILFTLGMLAVYRLGGHIPTPGVNADKLAQFFESNRGSFLGFVDLFSGGQLRRLTIFALGIMPYITASIILQLLTVVYEPLAKLQKEGELGRKKITQWTRYITVILSAVQSFGIAVGLEKSGDFVINPGWGFRLMTMLTLTTGSAFIMWLGEQITERGVGNGMSLLIFAGIVVGLPHGVVDLIDKAKNGAWGVLTFPIMIGLVVFMIAVVGFIVRGTLRAANPGPVCQAGSGTQSDGWPVYAPAVARECRRRDAGHLRVFDSHASANCRIRPAQPSLHRRSDSLAGLGRTSLHGAVCGRDYFLRVLLRVHRFQPQ